MDSNVNNGATPTTSNNSIDPQGRLDIAASKIAGRLIYHGLHEHGLGDLADGIGELVSPLLEGVFSDLFGTKPISLPVKLVQGVQNRLINGMDSRIEASRQQKK